jgi:hypothetical protein
MEEGKTDKLPALKVPRQCPLFLLVEVSLREGKALEVDFLMSRGKRYSMYSLP